MADVNRHIAASVLGVLWPLEAFEVAGNRVRDMVGAWVFGFIQVCFWWLLCLCLCQFSVFMISVIVAPSILRTNPV